MQRHLCLRRKTRAEVFARRIRDISEKDISRSISRTDSRASRGLFAALPGPSKRTEKISRGVAGQFIYAATAANLSEIVLLATPNSACDPQCPDAHVQQGLASLAAGNAVLQVLHEAFPSISGEQRTSSKPMHPGYFGFGSSIPLTLKVWMLCWI